MRIRYMFPSNNTMLSFSPSPSSLSPTKPTPIKSHFLIKFASPPLFCLDKLISSPIKTLTPSPTLKGSIRGKHTQTTTPFIQSKHAPPSCSQPISQHQTIVPSHQKLMLPAHSVVSTQKYQTPSCANLLF